MALRCCPPPRSIRARGPKHRAVPFAAVVLLIFVSTALRLPGTFLYPSFWAEDLTIFFKESIEMGPAALVQPLYGSYHTIPRLIALAASLGPVAWAPALFALGAGLVSSLCLALFSRPGFRWLVPRDDVRLFACWLFSFVPGTNESFFALCGVELRGLRRRLVPAPRARRGGPLADGPWEGPSRVVPLVLARPGDRPGPSARLPLLAHPEPDLPRFASAPWACRSC